MSVGQQNEFTESLLANAKEMHTFSLAPYAWLDCFGIPDSEIPAIKDEIIRAVRASEAEMRIERGLRGKHVLGRSALMLQSPFKEYLPKKFGHRMLCICRDIALRKSFIIFIKALIDKGRAVLQSWRAGDTTVPYPAGLFPPSMPLLSNLNPAVVPGL